MMMMMMMIGVDCPWICHCGVELSQVGVDERRVVTRCQFTGDLVVMPRFLKVTLTTT